MQANKGSPARPTLSAALYTAHFNLREPPFSAAPDPAYLYLSAQHQEALGHLMYGVGQYGGFVQLTGEAGTGKTTIVQALLRQDLGRIEVAHLHDPRGGELEFVAAICAELGVPHERPARSMKALVDALNEHLLQTHAAGGHTILIVDEAHKLDPGVLEQVRLLTNLETDKEKLLRIVLVGQPALIEVLARRELRQLNSRITTRYHLPPLSAEDTPRYIVYRLGVAGGASDLFSAEAMRRVHRHARGIPRRINAICDRALLGAYAKGLRTVTAEVVDQAASETQDGGAGPELPRPERPSPRLLTPGRIAGALAILALIVGGMVLSDRARRTGAKPAVKAAQATLQPDAPSAPAPAAAPASPAPAPKPPPPPAPAPATAAPPQPVAEPKPAASPGLAPQAHAPSSPPAAAPAPATAAPAPPHREAGTAASNPPVQAQTAPQPVAPAPDAKPAAPAVASATHPARPRPAHGDKRTAAPKPQPAPVPDQAQISPPAPHPPQVPVITVPFQDAVPLPGHAAPGDASHAPIVTLPATAAPGTQADTAKPAAAPGE